MRPGTCALVWNMSSSSRSISAICTRTVARRCWVSFFFFQAEDGIRDDLVTGVQTCALPISNQLSEIVDNIGLSVSGINMAYNNSGTIGVEDADIMITLKPAHAPTANYVQTMRSEERRVGKECRSRWSPYH